MNARENAVQAFVNGGWSEQIAREIVASVRAEALAEQAAEVAELEARLNAVAAYATSRVTGPQATNEASASWVLHLLNDDDAINPFRPCGCPKRFDRHAWGCPTVPEDPHASDLHHDYALGRDLPVFPRQRDEEAL